MRLREGEKILKVFYHHPTPFVLSILKFLVASLPFYIFTYFLGDAVGLQATLVMYFGVTLVLMLVIIYLSLIYWLDRLIITSMRVIHIDYKYLTVRDESEAFLRDIQDIQTNENGLLAYLSIFDYGSLIVNTAASAITVTFLNAPDPEAIRQYIYHVRQQ